MAPADVAALGAEPVLEVPCESFVGERYGRAVWLDVAAFISVTAVEALTHAAVLHRPDMLTAEKAEKFVDEVSDLVASYLEKS